MIEKIKGQIEENKLEISRIELDYKYLQRLFGTIPKREDEIREAHVYNYGFFDNFSLLHQKIDKYTPKFGFDLEKKTEYVKILFYFIFHNIFNSCLIGKL